MKEATLSEKIAAASRYINKKLAKLGQKAPDTALILGSGLGDFANQLTNKTTLAFSEIPHFPCPTVQGHQGALHFGKLGQTPLIMMQGRVHFYEGYPIETVVFPIRLFHALGVKNLLLTNAAGGIGADLTPASLMLISDHISLFGQNPLIGANDEAVGPRFPDMNCVYDADFRAALLKIASEQQIPLHEGVYCWTTGPSYETPAEIRLLKALGVGAVGMSTVPEAIVARHAGIRVAGLSCITNMAAGLSDSLLSHSEVLEAADQAKERFQTLLYHFLQQIKKL